MYKRYFKPLTDWIIALIALVILSPLFIITAIAIRIESSGSAFFLQERLGRFGKTFRVYKFRSMTIVQPKRNSGQQLFENDPRITKVGKFIRKTSIDELPQLINIIRCEMSFIGPRPPVTYFPKKYEDYNEFERQRFLVKPGISGLAAIRCREVHDWSVNIPIDVEYVKNLSFTLDFKLFAASLLTFFKTDNIYTKSKNS